MDEVCFLLPAKGNTWEEASPGVPETAEIGGKAELCAFSMFLEAPVGVVQSSCTGHGDK